MNKTLTIIILSCITLTLADQCPKWKCCENKNLPCAHSSYNATGEYSNVVIELACKKPALCIGHVESQDKDAVNVKGRVM